MSKVEIELYLRQNLWFWLHSWPPPPNFMSFLLLNMANFIICHCNEITPGFDETYFNTYLIPEAGQKRTCYILIYFRYSIGQFLNNVPCILGKFNSWSDADQKHVINTAWVQPLSSFSYILLKSMKQHWIKCKWYI